MKTIEVGSKKITLDIGEELRVKDLRKIGKYLKVFSKVEKGKEEEYFEEVIDAVISIVDALGGEEQAEIVDNMNIEEMVEFQEKLVPLFDTQKKIVKSSQDTHKK